MYAPSSINLARSNAREFARRATGILGALAVFVAAAVVTGAPGAAAAGTGTLLLQEDFSAGTAVSTEYTVGGHNFTPCLTSSGSGPSVPGRCSPTLDTPGNGALRLTPRSGNRSGFLLYDHPLPTKAGLDIEFNFYQYSGDGADGISFFLADGAYSLLAPGARGEASVTTTTT